jgi:hypothetical protein
MVEAGAMIAMGGLLAGLVGHIITTVWWASKITTVCEMAQKSLAELTAEMKSVNKTYVSKEDFARERAIAEKEHEAMWKQIDKLKEGK